MYYTALYNHSSFLEGITPAMGLAGEVPRVLLVITRKGAWVEQ